MQFIVFVECVIASFDKIDGNTTNTMLAKALCSIHRKLTRFHASCAAGIDNLDIEECLKDESNEEQQVKFEINDSRPTGSLVLMDQSKGPINPLWHRTQKLPIMLTLCYILVQPNRMTRLRLTL